MLAAICYGAMDGGSTLLFEKQPQFVWIVIASSADQESICPRDPRMSIPK
jgi:hypothetical protein